MPRLCVRTRPGRPSPHGQNGGRDCGPSKMTPPTAQNNLKEHRPFFIFKDAPGRRKEPARTMEAPAGEKPRQAGRDDAQNRARRPTGGWPRAAVVEAGVPRTGGSGVFSCPCQSLGKTAAGPADAPGMFLCG